MKIIARIYNGFESKFGVPRQSLICPEIKSRIVFEKEYRNTDAIRGLEGFSHLWLIWQFSEFMDHKEALTVRPPRLGGNKRVGVFATRSPFRPNPIGLSSVRLESVILDKKDGPVLIVSGADMMSGTPIYDIKPYISYSDSHPYATGGFTDDVKFEKLRIEAEDGVIIPSEIRGDIEAILSEDPRPQYHHDDERVYGISYSGYNIKFRVKDKILTIVSIESIGEL